MGKRVLVVFATRYGSARVVAEDIARYLEAKGHDVEKKDLRAGRAPLDLSEFDFVVAGSSVAMFSWMAKAKAFLRKCRKAGVPTVVYVTCGMAIEEPEKAQVRFLDKVIDRIGLRPELSRPIPPVIDFRPKEGLPGSLKGRIKATIEAMAKDKYEENGLMDFRDAGTFAAFLEEIENKLT